MIELKRALYDDFKSFYGEVKIDLEKTDALVIKVDGQIKCIGGVTVIDGHPFAFMDMTMDASRYGLSIMKAAKKGICEIYSKHDQVYAFEDDYLSTAQNFLKHIGFIKHDDNIYIWSNKKCQV